MVRGLSLSIAAVLFLAAGCARDAPPGTPPVTAALDALDAGEEASPPDDIAGHPAEEAILEGLRRDLWRVPSDGLFRPDLPASAGTFLAALWSAAGRPGGSERPFDEEREIREAVSWAAGEGSLDHTPDLSPDEPLTRQDAMEILFSVTGRASGTETMFTGLYDDAFPDSARLPLEERRALYWGVYNVLLEARDPGSLDPSGTVSRGEMAEMLVRFMDDFMSGTPEVQEGG